MTPQKKFCLTLAVSFFAALLIGIANKISVGLWLWPNVLPDAALIIRSVIAAFALTVFLFCFFTAGRKNREWLILAVIGLIISIGLGLVTKAWPAENAAQEANLTLPDYKNWTISNTVEWQDPDTGMKKKNIFFDEKLNVPITSVVAEYYERDAAKPIIVIWADVKYDNENMAIQMQVRRYSLNNGVYLMNWESKVFCFQKALCKR